MDQEKPFKTIEVVDSRTNQVCKVACMSCIRGHRTTSCGIPVCRTKIFWTVKRPGRPSNSCTCRYGATGGCKCVVARSACPHKSKKGEKRSGECRCDEQGRYCCLLEPNHWSTLLSLGKPTVDFFPTREALETKQAASMQSPSFPSTPAYSVASPPSSYSVPDTPVTNGHIQPLHISPNTYSAYPRPSTTLTPRFGMMGIGGPQGSQPDPPADILKWEGQAPPIPREFEPMYEGPPPERGSCCRTTAPLAQPIHPPAPGIDHSFPPPISMPQVFNGINGTHAIPMSNALPPLEPPAFDWNRLQTDYFNYQFPSAICQNCGLNGCTCKNCPPVFQNYGTGSWAQCCGRKHARDVQPSPAPVKIPRTEHYSTSQRVQSSQDPTAAMPQEGYTPTTSFAFDNGFGMDLPPPHAASEFPDFELDHELLLPDGSQALDISDFLMSDLDQSHEPNARPSTVTDDPGESEGRGSGGGGGGGGCCCGGP